jgi:lipoate-protein ligase A
MKLRIEQYFDNYSFYYKDTSDEKFYKVSAFSTDPISNAIVRKGFKNADFSKRKEVADEFKNIRFIESI